MKKTSTAKKKGGKASARVKPAGRIISARELPAARVENAYGRGKCVIVCDHASNKVPKSLANLGLSKGDLQKHIAWDPGTEDIGRYLSKALDCVAVLASYSRLVVDLNRGEDHKECMRDTSDHIRIPGNVKLTAAARQQRLDEIFWPYHSRIEKELRRHTEKGVAPVLISIHSFTPEMDGFRRPWHIGVLWNREEKLARRLVKNLRRNNPDLVIGENEPYSLKEANFMKNTISTHAESNGLPYVILEFRQDLVDTKKKAQKWAGIFLESLLPVLADPGLHSLGRKRA
ncbi:MAG: N-formylglutamate amidohydrolase [Alphaproteobacteria bacterium]